MKRRYPIAQVILFPSLVQGDNAAPDIVNNIEHFVYEKNLIQFYHGSFCSVGAKYKDKFLEVLENGNNTNSLECFNK